MCVKIRAYMDKLVVWSQRLSITTIRDPEEIIRLHFGESLFAIHLLPKGHRRLADVGSGAGFPGIPLRMGSPEMDLTLIESNSRKCVFLQEIVRGIGLTHVRIFKGRMDDFPGPPNSFDIVTGRAFGQHAGVVSWSERILLEDGILALWLVDRDASKVMSVPGWNWNDPAHIPYSRERCILIGSPKPR